MSPTSTGPAKSVNKAGAKATAATKTATVKTATEGAKAEKRPTPARPPLPPPTPKGTRDWAGSKVGPQGPKANSHFRLRSSRGR